MGTRGTGRPSHGICEKGMLQPQFLCRKGENSVASHQTDPRGCAAQGRRLHFSFSGLKKAFFRADTMSSSRGGPGSAGGARAEPPEAFPKEVVRIQETETDLHRAQDFGRAAWPGPNRGNSVPKKSRGEPRAGRSWAEQKDGLRGLARSCKPLGSRSLSTWHL